MRDHGTSSNATNCVLTHRLSSAPVKKTTRRSPSRKFLVSSGDQP